MILLRLLGGLSLTVDDEPVSGRAAQRHRIALLALLGASRTDPVSRERLVSVLWPEAGPRSRHLLSNSVHILRKALGDDVIVGTADALRLNPDRVRCDVREFDAAIAGGAWAAAVELYRGPFLDGFHLAGTEGFEAWTDGERERLARACAQALERLAAESESGGDYRSAADWWRRRLDMDPLAGRTVLHLMRALEAAGDIEPAVRSARAYESLVRAELDIEPDPAVVAFAERLARERSWRTDETVEGGAGPERPEAVPSRLEPADGAVPAAGPEVSGRRALAPGRSRTRRAFAYLSAVVVAGLGIAGVLRAMSDDAPSGTRSDAPASSAIRSTTNPAAYELYRRGTDPILLRSDSTAWEALRYLERAVALDPGFAAAWAGMAFIQLRVRVTELPGPPRRDRLKRAERAALRAVALDESLAQGHAALAAVRLQLLDLPSAEASVQRAIALEPANTKSWEILSNVYLMMGRFDEALREARHELALEPLSPAAEAQVARALAASGRCDEALSHLELLADLDPPLLRAAPIAFQCYGRQRMWPEAIVWLERAGPNRGPEGDALLGYAYARSGREAEALEIHERLLSEWRQGRGNALAIAESCVGLGRLDEALGWIERSVQEGTFPGTNIVEISEPMFEELRRQPGFERVARRMGLQKW